MSFADWTVVHDFMFVPGGAEVTTKAMANDVLPAAPVLYLGGRDEVVDNLGLDGQASRLLSPSLTRESWFRTLTPAYPNLIARSGVIQGNVIASSYAFAHHVRCTGRKVVYCHSPFRQIWSGSTSYEGNDSSFLRSRGLRWFRDYLREADKTAAATADAYIATSQTVKSRVQDCYGLEDVPVISPPVDTATFWWDPLVERSDFYLWVGRIIEPYKRLSVVIEAFRKLPNARLVIAGEGPDRLRLQRLSPPNVKFIGWQSRADVSALYRRCSAVIFPSADDFGLVAVEALMCGAVVICVDEAGPAETITDSENGIKFESADPNRILEALERHGARDWNHEEVSIGAQIYGLESFVSRVRSVLTQVE